MKSTTMFAIVDEFDLLGKKGDGTKMTLYSTESGARAEINSTVSDTDLIYISVAEVVVVTE